MSVSFSDLQSAFDFVSSGEMGENEAYLDRQSGKSSTITTRNCPAISTTRNTFQFRTRESSISASLWSWISLVTSYATTTTKFATSSVEEALIAAIRICWCDGAPSNGGTIFRTRPRKQLCGSGARRTGSTSVGPKVTLLLSAGGVHESAGYVGIRSALVRSCTDPAQKVRSCGAR